MRSVALVVLLALTPVLPATADTGGPPGGGNGPGGTVSGLEVVTRGEYSRVGKGMTRRRVERIFDTSGCEYVNYTSGERLLTGRQYENTRGNMVAVRYVTGVDGVERVRGKQWDTVQSC